MARAEVKKDMDGFVSSVQLGLNYTDRSKSLTPDEAFLGLAANTNGTASVAVPSQYRLGTTNLSYLGLGPMISYDPLALLNGGIYKLVPNAYGDVVVKSYSISERLLTPYLQANLKGTLGSADLTGNIGVQAIVTEQKSVGASAVYLGTLANGAPDVLAPIAPGATTPGLVGLITGAISMSPEPMQPAGLPELFIVQGIHKALAGSGMWCSELEKITTSKWPSAHGSDSPLAI